MVPAVAREFRGVWVASVGNIDWPSRRGLSTDEAQRELIAVLDRAVELHLNAVILQVRPAADALYESKIEPWSEYLTGVQGQAPEPFWDPLAVAVREAHARGLELHAWFNPYRARYENAKSPLAANHIARTNPKLVKTYGPYLWMDPAEPAVRARTLRVVADVVRRYDIDGVHIDDYFYPYKERDRRGREIDFPDQSSWSRYVKSGGKLSRADWRRQNVNLLVEALHDSVHALKPWVKFGISPFGIWRPGYPSQIRGLDAYTELYADARKWLREGWVDYFTPQLYWATTRPQQSYAALLAWWASENVHGRHLWPGNFTSQTGGSGSNAWPVSELLEQISLTRTDPGASGNVHFSMKAFLDNQAGIVDTLRAGPYADEALVPPSPWLRLPPPPTPYPSIVDSAGTRSLRFGTANERTPWQWLVQVGDERGWSTRLVPGSVQRFPLPARPWNGVVAVTAINRAGESSETVTLQ